MVGWTINGHEFEHAPGDGEGQGGLVCCSPRGHNEWDTTERLNMAEVPIWGPDMDRTGKQRVGQSERVALTVTHCHVGNR